MPKTHWCDGVVKWPIQSIECHVEKEENKTQETRWTMQRMREKLISTLKKFRKWSNREEINVSFIKLQFSSICIVYTYRNLTLSIFISLKRENWKKKNTKVKYNRALHTSAYRAIRFFFFVCPVSFKLAVQYIQTCINIVEIQTMSVIVDACNIWCAKMQQQQQQQQRSNTTNWHQLKLI